MYRIAKQFSFCAMHHLTKVPEGHKCARPHGHNYTVHLVLESEHLDPCDFVLDYGELRRFAQWVDVRLDHRNLNEVLEFETTAENIARYIYEEWKGVWPSLVEVMVSETPKTWASYRE